MAYSGLGHVKLNICALRMLLALIVHLLLLSAAASWSHQAYSHILSAMIIDRMEHDLSAGTGPKHHGHKHHGTSGTGTTGTDTTDTTGTHSHGHGQQGGLFHKLAAYIPGTEVHFNAILLGPES